jgi:hypothetical protein
VLFVGVFVHFRRKGVRLGHTAREPASMNPLRSPLSILACATALSAGVCEDTFKKSGNPLSGSKYDAVVRVDGLTVPAAVAQLRGLAIAKKLDILSEDSDNGSMLLEDPESTWRRSIPYVVDVTAEANAVRIQMTLKLNKGVFAKSEFVQTRMCELLTQVAGGKEGEAAAANAASAAAVKREPRKVEANAFSRELARQTVESATAIPLRYKDRAFTIQGKVDYVIKDGGVYRVAFKIDKPTSTITIPGAANPTFKIDISCLMATKYAAWAVALREGEKVTITGVYHDYDEFKKVMWLKDCQPER